VGERGVGEGKGEQIPCPPPIQARQCNIDLKITIKCVGFKFNFTFIL